MPVQMIQQAYKFALDPTPAQAATLASHAGARRYAFNWAHAMISAAADARREQQDAGEEVTIQIPGQFEVGPQWTAFKNTATGCRRCRRLLTRDGDGRWVTTRDGEPGCDNDGAEAPHEPTIVTCGRCCTHMHQTPDGHWADSTGSTECPEATRPGTPHDLSSEFLAWTSEVFSGTIQAAQRDADVAWKRHLSGKARRPRFKKKGKCTESFQVHGDGLKLAAATRIIFPKIGAITVMSDDSAHPAMRRSRARSAPGRTRHIGNRRRSRQLWRHLRNSAPKAAELGPLLRQIREDAGLDIAGAVRTLNAVADQLAAGNAAAAAAALLESVRQDLADLDAEHRAFPEPGPGQPRDDYDTAMEGFAAARKKIINRLRYAEKKAAAAPAARAGRTDAWSDAKLTKLEQAGVTSGLDQATVICAAYGVTEELQRKITHLAGQARIIRASITLGADGIWWCSAGAEIPMEVRTAPTRRQREGGIIGLDFGVREIATASNGVRIPNPRHYERNLAELRDAQRRLSRSQPGSKRREKDRRAVGLIHADTARLRADAIHRATTVLVQQHDVIAVEGWNVQQVMRDGSKDLPRRIRRDRNRALADTGIGIGREQLKYKGPRYGTTIMVTAPDAATGRTCHVDGKARTTPLPPGEERFTSDRCPHTAPRRENTAKALAAWARQEQRHGPSPGAPAKPRRGDTSPGALGARQSPVKRAATSSRLRRGEAGTPGG